MSEGWGGICQAVRTAFAKGNDFSKFEGQKESGAKISWVGLKK